MVLIAKTKKTAENDKVLDLFRTKAPGEACELRGAEQRRRLMRLAVDLAKLLDNLQLELCMDRERAVSMLAECSGLLELAVEEMGEIRDVDEHFGGRRGQRPRIAALAEKLERGLVFLLGVFSAVGSGENLSTYNWKLVERDVQRVIIAAADVKRQLTPDDVCQAA